MIVRFALALSCLLLGLVALLAAIDASGSLQDAPPGHEQTRRTLPCTAAFMLLGGTSVWLFVKQARRGL